MNPLQWATKMMAEREFIKQEMRVKKLSTAELAALANLNMTTVTNYIEGRTFSPHHRTVEAMFWGLGYEAALPNGKIPVRRYVEAKDVLEERGEAEKGS